MGIINPSKMPKATVKKRRDNTDFTEDGQVRQRRDNTDFTEYAEGGEVWDKARPKGLGKPKKLSPAKKSSAKAMAKAAGRPYPNLIDNMRAAKK
jgi:hypothetical protein